MRVVISGASRGIGLALVGEYLAQQADVVAICRSPADASDLNGLDADNGRLTIVAGDVAAEGSLAEAQAAVGDRPVDLLLNVAGLIHPEAGPDDIDFEAWRRSLDIMVLGPFRTLRAFLPNLKAARGKIVSISSQMGASDWSHGGNYSYVSAKAALNRAMKSMALDLREHDIIVALIHPGHVRTELGGPDGAIDTVESASGIRAVADKLTLDETGSFHNWDGTEHAW